MGETMESVDVRWEDLRREARKIEGDLDVKLSSYAKLGGRLAHGGYNDAGSSTDVIAGDRSWKSMEMEIQSLLEKLLDTNDAMSRSAAAATPTTSVTQKLARHRDILHEFTQVTEPLVRVLRMVDGDGMPMGFIYEAMDRAKEAISHYYGGNKKKYEIIWRIIDRRWTNQLHQPIHAFAYFLNPRFYFSETFGADEEVMAGLVTCIDKMVPNRELRDKVLDELEEFKRTKGNINAMREHAELLTSVRNDISEYRASGSMSPGPSLLRERAAIHGSITQIDDVISQAQATKGVLSSQRTLFVEIQGKVKQLSDKFPVIRGLLGAIKRKRSKDTLILSAVIAGCTVFLILYWLAK